MQSFLSSSSSFDAFDFGSFDEEREERKKYSYSCNRACLATKVCPA